MVERTSNELPAASSQSAETIITFKKTAEDRPILEALHQTTTFSQPPRYLCIIIIIIIKMKTLLLFVYLSFSSALASLIVFAGSCIRCWDVAHFQLL